jgi:hypothetical protein
MARIRSIKPEFFTSLTIGSLSERARLAFIGIWTTSTTTAALSMTLVSSRPPCSRSTTASP